MNDENDDGIQVCEGIESRRAEDGDPDFPVFVDCHKGDRKLEGRAAFRTEEDARRMIDIWSNDLVLKFLYGTLRYEVLLPTPEARPLPTKRVFYLAHPVSGDHVGNAMRAVQWIRWFAESVPHLIVVAPWVAEVLAFPTSIPSGVGSWEWALANDETIVQRTDGVITVGGKISKGMQREVDAALRNGGTHVDMSRYSVPADVPEDFFIDEDI